MDAGQQFTLWTVRAAVLLWSVGLSLRAAGRGEPLARWAWVIGCAALVIHIAGAFAFFHGGRWDHAYDATARQTEAVFGLNWGGGLYVNFVFAGVWMFDAVWRIARPNSYSSRSLGCEAAIQGFLWFIVFNGAVVFAVGSVRWFGAVACAAPVAIAILRWLRRRRTP